MSVQTINTFVVLDEFSQSDIAYTDIRNVLLAELTASLLGGLVCERVCGPS